MLRGAVLFTLVLAPLAGAQQFTYDSNVIPGQNLWTNGVELADLDGDGDLDVLFANGSGYDTDGGALQQKFYRNDGGVFVGNHGALNVINMNAEQVIAEDFDNDGDLDLMYCRMGNHPNPAHTPRLLINQGFAQAGTEGVFADVTATNLPTKTLSSFSLCAGDVDNDGDLDVVITDGGTFGGAATRATLYENDGNAVFTDVTNAQIPNDTYNAQDVTLFDFDGDFDVDIALSGKGASSKRGRLYLNNGAGVFSVSTVFDGMGSGATYEIEYGDLDGDGDWDAAVQSITSQNEGWAINNGTGSAPTETTFGSPNGDDDNEMGLLDYDLDGDLDVFVGSLASREKAYRNNGNNTFTNVNSIIGAVNDDTMDLDFGDLDGDGAIDMVTAQGEGSGFRNKAYMNSGAADTLAPVVVGTRNPAAFTDSCAVYIIDVKDQISEDGHVGVEATYDWTTTGVGGTTGSGTATRMGGGLYRAEVPTILQTATASLTWTLTDQAGNATVSGPHVVSTQAWKDIGSGHPGVTGAPILSGTGKLLGGTAGSINLTNAAPSEPAVLFVSVANSPTALHGGTLQAFPFIVLVVLVTNGSGEVTLPYTSWQAGLPGGFNFWLQYGVQDAAAVGGVSLSNALEVTSP